jgi:hypothetical protein
VTLDDVVSELGIEASRELLAARWRESEGLAMPAGWPAADEVEEAARFARLSPEAAAACTACRSWIVATETRRRLFRHCFHLLFRAPGATAGLARDLPTLGHLSDPAPLFGAVLCLCAVGELLRRHAARGVSEEVTAETLRDLELWMAEHRRRSGRWGFSELVWLWHHLSGTIVQLGRLQFEVATYGGGFRGLVSRGGEGIVVLAGDGMVFRADGQFADADGGRAGHDVRSARLIETERGWEGERMDPRGIASGTRVSLRRESWSPLFGNGDPVLGVHIPAGGDPPGNGAMTDEACAKSFAAARAFFPRHYPEHAPRAFTSTTWLLDPQLAAYLPETSNIVRFQRRFHLLPVPGAGPAQHFERVFGFGAKAPAGPAEIDALEQAASRGGRAATAVERALLEHARHGGRWRMTAGVIPFAENVTEEGGR